MLIENNETEIFIRMPDLLKLIPMSESQIWAMAADGRFPRPYKLSSKVSAWLYSEIVEWMKTRPKSM